MRRSSITCTTAGLLVALLCAGCMRMGFVSPPDASAPHDAAEIDTSTPPHDGSPPDAAAPPSDALPKPDAPPADLPKHDAPPKPDAALPDAQVPDKSTGPTKGLLISFPLDDNPADGVNDVSGTKTVATCSSCPKLVGGAYHFSGAQYVKVTPEPRFQTKTGFTVAIWARPSHMGKFQAMASKLYGTGFGNSWQLTLRKSTSCADRFYFETTNGNGYPVIKGADAVTLDRWWHVATTWDGSSKRLYLDGVLVASSKDTTLWDSGPIYVGCDWDNGAPGHHFFGALRDFRLYDRALTAAEIGQLTAGQVSGPAPAVPGAVTALVLIDAATDKDIGPLTSPATISLPAGGINVRAEVSGAPGSVRFDLDGKTSYRVESSAPFSLEGDTSGDYNAWKPASGLHTITATPFCDSGATGTTGAPVTVKLTVK